MSRGRPIGGGADRGTVEPPEPARSALPSPGRTRWPNLEARAVVQLNSLRSDAPPDAGGSRPTIGEPYPGVVVDRPPPQRIRRDRNLART